jgi:hypothetical protein
VKEKDMSKKKARRSKKPKRMKRRPALSREDKISLELLEKLASAEIARQYRKVLQLIRRGRVSEGVESIIRLGQQEEVGTLILSNKLTHLYIEHGAVHEALILMRRRIVQKRFKSSVSTVSWPLPIARRSATRMRGVSTGSACAC